MPLGRIGKYDRVDVLGHGASGIVYLAWDTLLKKQIALKEVDLQVADINRFMEEARLLDRLDHPNIVRVNGVDVVDGRVLLSMEYVKGQTLQQRMREQRRLPVRHACSIMEQVLDALEFAHSHRTVHRDIKPANILINDDGRVKLVDFGLAEILATNAYAGGAGTYAYMAPEDFDEERHSDHRADIWACGVVLHELLTGERPFKPDKPRDPFAWRKHLRETPYTALSKAAVIPAELDEIIAKALRVDRADRYLTAAEFRDRLRALLGGELLAEASGDDPGACRRTNFSDEDLAERPVPEWGGVAVLTRTGPATSSDRQSQAATIPAEAPPVRQRLLGRRQVAKPLVVSVDHPKIEFGEVRKGDDRWVRARVRLTGGDRRVTASVGALPEWLEVSPVEFSRRKADLTFRLRSEAAPHMGRLTAQPVIRAGEAEAILDISALIRPPRPRFAEIALWYFPLVVFALLPLGLAGWTTLAFASRMQIPGGAAATALLSLILLQVAFAAELRSGERTVAGVMACMGAAAVGVSFGAAGQERWPIIFNHLAAYGIPLGGLVMLQLFSRKQWRVWALVLVCMALIIASNMFQSAQLAS